MDQLSKLNTKDEPFLTSLPKPLSELDASIPQADTINLLYSQINTCITVTSTQDLDSKVGNVLSKHEADFLNVYKGHMYNIQKEMRILKEKVSEEELKRKRDEELKSLEKERDWFRNEALRLDKLCKQHKRNLEIWKNKAQILEEDRKFMENQILLAKRQNLKLIEGLESQKELNFSAEKTWIKNDEPLKLLDSRPETAERHEKVTNTIRHLQNQIDVQKKSIKFQNAVHANYFLEKGELEDFFLDCIEEVKKEIKKRKNQQIPFAKLSASASSKSLYKADDEPGLKDFTSSDKRKVVELIVCREEVVRMLQELIFPKNMQRKHRPTTGNTHGLSHVFSSPSITDYRTIIRPNTAPKGWNKK
jgi:hypothetical protein